MILELKNKNFQSVYLPKFRAAGSTIIGPEETIVFDLGKEYDYYTRFTESIRSEFDNEIREFYNRFGFIEYKEIGQSSVLEESVPLANEVVVEVAAVSAVSEVETTEVEDTEVETTDEVVEVEETKSTKKRAKK